MKTYSVAEISDMVNTNPETVRRWIRSGKLPAERTSRKDGNAVKEEDLYGFLKKSNKYSDVAKTMLLANPMLGTIMSLGIVVGAVAASNKIKKSGIDKEDYQIDPEDVKSFLQKNIDDSYKEIAKKKEAISQLKKEIKKEEEKIEDYRYTMSHIDNVVNINVKENKND